MNGLRYLSLFSGMEAAHLAFRSLGWTCVGVAEIEPAPCALLAHRLPHVPNLGSVLDITDERIAALGHIDVVIGGSPCQDLSVAGKRAGLVGARSSLFHEQSRIFDAARSFCGARWLIWENVPGAFSSHKGRDFAVVVGTLAGLDLAVPQEGWGTEGVAAGPRGLVEWSVLDAQWFGLAQRRKRVFAVLDTGDWSDRSPILLERESLRGDYSPRRETGEGFAGSITQRIDRGGVNSEGSDGHLIPETVGALTDGAHNGGWQNGQDAYTASAHPPAIAYRWAESANESMTPRDVAPPLRSNRNGEPAVGVRRLTPRECERLQGAPDDWTLAPRKGKPMADGPRYKMLGNSFAVPCICWIGQQIQRAYLQELEAAA